MGSEPCGDTQGATVSPPPPLRRWGDVRWPKPNRGLGIMGGKRNCVCFCPLPDPGAPQGMSHMAAPKPALCPRESPAGDGAESKQAVWNSVFPADGSADSAAPLTINRECCWVGPSCTLPRHHGCSWGQLHHAGRGDAVHRGSHVGLAHPAPLFSHRNPQHGHMLCLELTAR